MSSNNPFAAQPAANNPFAAQPQALTAAPKRKKRKKNKKKGKRAQEKNGFERRFLSERYRGGRGALEIAMLWQGNIFAIDQYKGKKDQVLMMGSDEEVTYPIEGVSGSVPFATLLNGQWAVTFPSNIEGFILGADNTKMSFEAAEDAGLLEKQGNTYALSMQGTTRAKLVFGDVTFLVHYISVPALSIPVFAGVSVAGFLVALVSSLVIHGIFGGFVLFDTDAEESLTLEQMTSGSAFAEALITPEDMETPDEDPVEEPKDEDNPDTPDDPGAKAPDKAGAVGTPDTPEDETGGFAIAGDKPNMALKRQYDSAVAHRTGLLAQANTMSSLLGSTLEAEGNDSINAWGSFAKTAPGNVHGGYGLSVKGPWRGGGGSNYGGFGPGDLGTTGKSNGPGDPNADWNKVQPIIPDKTNKVPVLKPEDPKISGSLNRRIIRKVINQHKREVKKCYERELIKDNRLKGKIEVKFIIDPTGNVQMASVVNSSMKGRAGNAVGSCLTRAIKKWRFPAPKPGGMVKVTYPFVFSSK